MRHDDGSIPLTTDNGGSGTYDDRSPANNRQLTKAPRNGAYS